MHFKQKPRASLWRSNGGAMVPFLVQSLKCVLNETCRFKNRIVISFQFTVIVEVMI